MAAKKRRRAFISYSRVNKEFATKLTKALRSEGFPVWFDQLDIPTGARWDDEVEKALRECSIFLIILTPAAIASENVKDEIGYAIDHGKRILPVLLEDCDVPLRLRRFQYVDFTAKSFEEGFESAKELLSDLAYKTSVQIPAPTPAVKALAESKSVPVPEVSDPKKPVPRRLLIGAAAIVVLVLAGIGFGALLRNRGSNLPTVEPSVVESPATEGATVDKATSEVLDIGSTRTGNDGMILFYVPAGEFNMGSDGGELNEQPVHPVELDAFWIDQTEVTNKMYAACVSSEACVSPSSTSSQSQINYYGNPEFENYPVIFVTWDNANTYCSWAGRRLPTEAEWEKAARGLDERPYPWGKKIDGTVANFHSNEGDTTAVARYEGGKSPYGALDMAGNVTEWVSDWYSEIFYLSHQSSPLPNPTGPTIGELRVLRGGSWKDSDFRVRSAYRITEDPADSSNTIGFRCALSP